MEYKTADSQYTEFTIDYNNHSSVESVIQIASPMYTNEHQSHASNFNKQYEQYNQYEEINEADNYTNMDNFTCLPQDSYKKSFSVPQNKEEDIKYNYSAYVHYDEISNDNAICSSSAKIEKKDKCHKSSEEQKMSKKSSDLKYRARMQKQYDKLVQVVLGEHVKWRKKELIDLTIKCINDLREQVMINSKKIFKLREEIEMVKRERDLANTMLQEHGLARVNLKKGY